MKGFRVRQDEIYERDIAILKQFSDDLFKITHFNSLRKAGFELSDDRDKGKKNTAGNIVKSAESISRTRSRIFEIAICNDWDYFCTFTLNREYRDRYDVDTFRKQFTKWINNYNSKYGLNIRYVFVLEYHRDKAIHAHGLISGILIEHLKTFDVNDKLPFKLLRLLSMGREIYNWPAYADSFGHTTL